MNIELARTFLEVVSHGSFAKAADRLHVTHSTVTMRIKTLEDILRHRVLIRNKTGVTMTAAGIRFYYFAESLVRTWQMTRRQMSLAAGFEGILSVGAEASLWDDLMFDWTCNTRQQRPEVAIRCETGTAEALTQRLFQGWLDFCIIYTTHSRNGFVSEKLFDDPLILVSTEDRHLRTAWDPEFIEIDWDDGYRAQVEHHWEKMEETPHISVTTQSLGLRFITKFGGSTWIPLRIFEKSDFPRQLYRVHNAPVFPRTAYMLYSPEALKGRMPRMTADKILHSVHAQLKGQEILWPKKEKPTPQAICP